MHNLFNQRLELVETTYLAFLKIKYEQTKSRNSENNIRKLSVRYNKNQQVQIECETVTKNICKILKEEHERNVIFTSTVE